nr:hypothetical protein [uncultured Cohaesibacter sp.]
MTSKENGESGSDPKKPRITDVKKEMTGKGSSGFAGSKSFFHWGKIFAGAYLAFFYGLALYLSVMTLATHQIQQKTKALSTESVPIYFWLLKEVGDEDRRLQELQQDSADIKKLRDELNTAYRDLKKVELEYDLKRLAYINFMNDTLKPAGVAKFKSEYVGTYAQLENKYTFLYSNIEDYVAENSDAELKKLADLRGEFNAINVKKKEADANYNILQTLLNNYNEYEEGRRDDVKVILEKVYGKNYIDHFNQIYTLAKEFRSLEDSFCIEPFGKRLCIMETLATKQSEIVTLVLVLIMGALGGLIHLTQSFLDNEETPVSYYIFRPILGILAAFSIFVLVKAGVLVVSGEGFDETKSLNPFFVAFLGIVSGLMAQNAIMNLRQAGANLFRSQNALEQPRWAIADPGNSVMDKLKQQPDKDIAKLAKILDKEQGQVEDWLHGRKCAPLHVQQAVASWLDSDVHELFHDMKTFKPDNTLPKTGGQEQDPNS